MKKSGAFLLILTLLGISCYFSWSLYFKVYSQEDTVNIHVFPNEIGDWKAEELTITDDEYAILETRNAFVRRYRSSSDQVVDLFIVYSQNNRKVSHPPEVCYTGSGVVVVGKTVENINTGDSSGDIEATRLLLEHRNYQQISYYWYKVGDSYIASYWNQQVQVALKSLFGEPASSALIRVSSVIKNANISKAKKDTKEFARLIYSDLNKYLP